MTEFSHGHLVFVVSNSLAAVHTLASQISRLNSDAHLLDVGLLASDAWVAAWIKDVSSAETLSKQIGGECVPLSSEAAKALFSLGDGLSDGSLAIGLLEYSGTRDLADFFNSVAHCQNAGWDVMEIRVRKSGPPGAHAYFAKSQSARTPSVSGFVEIEALGEYRKFF